MPVWEAVSPEHLVARLAGCFVAVSRCDGAWWLTTMDGWAVRLAGCGSAGEAVAAARGWVVNAGRRAVQEEG